MLEHLTLTFFVLENPRGYLIYVILNVIVNLKAYKKGARYERIKNKRTGN